MFRFLFFIATLLFCAFHSYQGRAQQNVFQLPESLPQPEWYRQIDWEHPNIHKIEALISTYKKRKPTDQFYNYERDDEDPYLTAYLRWKRERLPFIQPDGSLIQDPNYYQNLLQQALQTQQQSKPEAGNWTVLGPTETIRGNGYTNDQVNCYELAIAPSNSNVLYLGTETGILFKSIDKGLNWFSVSDALPQQSATALVVHPTDPNTVYWSSSNNTLLKSTDGGQSWNQLTNFPNTYARRLVILPATLRVVAAANNGAIYYSDNGGNSWTASSGISANASPVYDLEMQPTNPNTLYAVKHDPTTNKWIVILRSSDGGTSFSTATVPTNVSNNGARLATTPANANTVFCIALGVGSAGVPKLLKSTDAGLTYTVSANFTGTGLIGTNGNNGMSNGQGDYDLALMANPNNANEVIVGTTSAFRSTDGGANFSPLGGYLGPLDLHPDMQCMRAHNNDAFILTDGGVNYSTDFFAGQANFSIRHKGLSGADYWGFGQGWTEDIVVGGRYHNGNAALYDQYPTGQSIALGGGEDATGHVFTLPERGRDVGFRDIGSKTIPLTINGNVVDAPFTNTKWPSDNYYGEFSSKLMQDPRYSHVWYVGKDSTLWKTENNGSSYIALKNFNAKIYRFDIARSNPDVMYVCALNGIYKTTNGGTTWATLTLPAGVTFANYNTDIAVDPLNENNVWYCQAQGAIGNKIFKSTNGGNTWVNYGDASVNNKYIAYIVPQGGTNGGVYAIHARNPAKVYYRDNGMSAWADYSDGLPQNIDARQGALIFYRDNKIRIVGNRGAWESPLYTNATPVAQPMADRNKLYCTRDTVRFTDYSILKYAGATRTWSFPGATYVSSTTAREPKVLYGNAGNYNVTLTVTDAQNNTHTKTVANMISVSNSACEADTVIGKCLSVPGGNTYHELNIGTAPINSNNFSLSCWIRPSGKQKSFSQLISHDPYPGSSYGFGLGFAFMGYTRNLNLCYTDNVVGYGNNSSLVCDSTQWNFVVLTYSATGVKIYLNGKSATVNNNTMAAIDLSKTPFYINRDIHNQGGDYQGEIDEVKIYNYALSENEVREKMHLIQNNALQENGLVKYVQFNQLTPNGDLYELKSPTLVGLPGGATSIITSTAPVATGKVFRKSVTTSGQHTFTGTGIDLFWPTNATLPSGDVVGFRLNSLPDQKPTTSSTVPTNQYYIVNNYGSNNTFSPLTKIRFSEQAIPQNSYSATNFSLYKRSSTAYGNTWGSSLGTASNFTYGANSTGYLEFNGTAISSAFTQFAINNSGTPISIEQKHQIVVQETDIITVWPIPSSQFVNLKLSKGYDQPIPLSMSNASGQIVATYTLLPKETYWRYAVSGLAKGVYFITVSLPNAAQRMYKVVVE